MGRKLGKNVLMVCEAIEQNGPMNYKQVRELTGLLKADEYCQRAHERKLLVTELSEKPRHRVYELSDDWRDKYNESGAWHSKKLNSKDKQKVIISSVFDLAKGV